ncbi:MAG: ABC transporter permease [Chloroflexia bacterium]|nr:ABC transporter permease [Chloroflexia bacterium]
MTRATIFETLLVQALAVVTALAVGAALILATGGDPLLAYGGLWEGSFGRPASVSETLVWATPYILAGLAVALAFKGGLFNIGAEGQLAVGALFGAWIGFGLSGVPWPLHALLALVGGACAGAAWAGIAGVLKARTGAHEVITTIMLNYIALLGTGYLLAGPLKDPSPFVVLAQTPKVLESARLPALFADFRIHWGFAIALLLAVGAWWLLFKSTVGFAIRTVGLNPTAAQYAGISVGRTIVLTMALSGALAGIAGAIEVVGVNYYHTPGFSVGYGFDSIAVALLGKSHPLGVVPAAILFGALRAGATRMQFVSQIPIDVISIVQALVLMFVAADQIVRGIYRIRRRPSDPTDPSAAETTVTRTWGRVEG